MEREVQPHSRITIKFFFTRVNKMLIMEAGLGGPWGSKEYG